LIDLKKCIRETLETLLEFGIIQGSLKQFAKEDPELNFFNDLSRSFKKLSKVIKKHKEDSILKDVNSRVFLTEEKIASILAEVSKQSK